MAHHTTKFLNKPAICIHANAVLRAARFAQLPKLLLDVLESPSNCKQSVQTAGCVGCLPRAMQALTRDPLFATMKAIPNE
jgi:hypothetical protein